MYGEEEMVRTVRIDLRGVKIAGKKPRLLDMCNFLEKGLKLDVDSEVRYLNVCPVRPVCYVQLAEEEKAEEVGRALREGVAWSTGAVYGARVDARIKILNVKGVASGVGKEEVMKKLEDFVEVKNIKPRILEEYPFLDTGEFIVEVEKGMEERVPPFIRWEKEGLWKVTWWGQGQTGCWKCLKMGHQGWQCREEEKNDVGFGEDAFEETLKEQVKEMVKEKEIGEEKGGKKDCKRKGSGILDPQEREKKGKIDKKGLSEEEKEQNKNPKRRTRSVLNRLREDGLVMSTNDIRDVGFQARLDVNTLEARKLLELSRKGEDLRNHW